MLTRLRNEQHWLMDTTYWDRATTLSGPFAGHAFQLQVLDPEHRVDHTSAPFGSAMADLKARGLVAWELFQSS